MPVTDLHRNYPARQTQWGRCRDAFEGADAVKAAGETYLPRLGGQKQHDYEAYVKRATWYGATARTILGLTGSVMRKPPTFEGPDAVQAQMDNVTGTNESLAAFTARVVQEVLTVGRVGVLLDLPQMVAGEVPRPYWVRYTPEQITNWRCQILNGVKVLTLVVLREEVEAGGDQFTSALTRQYRVLQLTGGVYQVFVYRQVGESSEFTLVEELIPRVRGEALPYIPFVFINPLNLDVEPDKPPLLDMIDLNYSHYMTSADLEHGRHFTALPTPYVTGIAKDTALRIGSSTAWAIPAADAKVGMLEFTGQGLQALEKAADSKERQMAVLGARMLEEQKAQVEATETHAIRRSGESSMLASIAETISIGLTMLVQWHAQWVGVSAPESELKVGLNKDFFGLPLSPTEIAELVRTWQAGGISYETLYYNLQQGEITRPGITADDEKTQIELETPDIDLEGGDDDEGNDQSSAQGDEGSAGQSV